MGTYTTNKNLFMPTVGEQGWGTLVNGNFETIDTYLKPISLSGSTYTFTGNQKGGSISATSITNSGTLTSTGKITANGGIGTTSITTSGTITADKFSCVVTVTPNEVHSGNGSNNVSTVNNCPIGLPAIFGVTYKGSYKLYSRFGGSMNIRYYTTPARSPLYVSVSGEGFVTITLNSVQCLLFDYNGTGGSSIEHCGYTLS